MLQRWCIRSGAFTQSLILRFLTAKSNSLWCIQGFLHAKAADVSIFNLFHYAFCESQQESWMNCMARPQLRWQSSLSAIEPTSKMDGLVWWMDELYEMWDSIFCFGTFWNQMVWWFDGLKMSPFLSAFFEVDSRPRVSTSCRGGSHHSIGNVQWHGCTSAAGSGSLERSFSKFDVAGCECWWSFWELWGEKLRTIASEEAVGNWWALAFAVDMFLQGKHDASQPDVARFWSSFL